MQKILIPTLSEAERTEILAVANLIKHEVNVKEIEFIDDASGILVKQIKPNFRTLGPKYGKQMKDIATVINDFTQQDIQALERQGTKEITLDGKVLTLTLDDVEITSQDIEGWLVASSSTGLVVALDATITDELRAEGIARELVNRIQNLRKDTGLEVTDSIRIRLQKQDTLEKAVRANEAYIKAETLANEILFADTLQGEEVAFDDIVTKIVVEKA